MLITYQATYERVSTSNVILLTKELGAAAKACQEQGDQIVAMSTRYLVALASPVGTKQIAGPKY